MSRDALIVGINSYHHLSQLAAPASDAEAVYRLLFQYGGFDNIKPLPLIYDNGGEGFAVGKTTSLSHEDLEEALIELFNPKGRAAETALFYFSGHGQRRVRGGISEGYLATSDSQTSGGNMGISLDWLRKLLTASPVRRQIILFDCCYSGELLNLDKADPNDRGQGHDRCFIAASREYQLAYEQSSGKHGILTAALLKALDPKEYPSGLVDNHALVAHLQKHWQSTLQSPLCTNSGAQIIITRDRSKEQQIEIPYDSNCPYKGLSYFDCNDHDAGYFFGRELLIDQLIERVRSGNMLAVLGPSGSGKSSVVRAGLLYHLKQGGRITGSKNWPTCIFSPGEKPLHNLAWAVISDKTPDELERARVLLEKQGGIGLEQLLRDEEGSSNRVVLAVDQFEEIFTLCTDKGHRQQFLACLLDAVRMPDSRICLVLTMRADFLGRCAEQEYSGLSCMIQEHLATITPMNEEELREAIVRPAECTGLGVEPELVKKLVEEVKDLPGSLPLVQDILTELWHRNHGQKTALTLSGYIHLGGISKFLGRRADKVYEALKPEEQVIARRLFIALTQLGEGAEDTRRQVSKEKLLNRQDVQEAKSVDEVLDKMTNARLIVTDEVRAKGEDAGRAVIDVAHETLIRHWRKLRTWLDENRDNIRFQRRLETAATYWKDSNRPKGLLWRSPDLDQLKKFAATDREEMDAVQQDFFAASLRSQRREKLFRVGAVVFMIMALAIAVLFFQRDAARQRKFFEQEKKFADEQTILMKRAEKNEQKALVNLTRAYEEKARSSLQDSFNGENSLVNFQKAWLYTIESLNQKISIEKSPYNSLNRLVTYNFIPTPKDYLQTNPSSKQLTLASHPDAKNMGWFDLLNIYLKEGRESQLFRELYALSWMALPYTKEKEGIVLKIDRDDDPELWSEGYPMSDPAEWIEQSLAKAYNEGRIDLEILRQDNKITESKSAEIKIRSLLLKSEKQARQGDYAEARKLFEQALAIDGDGMQKVDVQGHHARILEPFTNKLDMTFVYIPPGTFLMGSPGIEPHRNRNETRHKVSITKGFYIQTTEVSVGQWREFVRETGYQSQAETEGGCTYYDKAFIKDENRSWKKPSYEQDDDYPVACISWNDTQKFIEWLRKKDGENYRLPSEAQWEYAARAGTLTPFYFGECQDSDKANFRGDKMHGDCPESALYQRNQAVSVNRLGRNGWGLYHMHGNVFEWCQDWYSEEYPVGHIKDPSGPDKGKHRVFRSGSWANPPWYSRSAQRGDAPPDYTNYVIGFRLVMLSEK
ncbi:MAG: SUMF1/EgtB/PvdO family nonheme iron enzyme [Candidatus Electrothrix sp. YB6]